VPYEIAWQQPNGLIKRHFGHVTSSEVLAANVQAEADARFDDLNYVINDFRDCTGLTVSPDDIAEIAAIDKAASKTNPHIRIAVVATNSEVLAAATAYANDPLTTFTVRLFSSMNDACSWLGVSTA
jgi:hypothetical protein